MQRILVFNLTPRFGMLHYASQFSNELTKRALVAVIVADYYDGFLYNENVELINIRAQPDIVSFVLNSLAFWRHIGLLIKILRFNPDVVHFTDNHPWYIPYSWILKRFKIKIYVTQHDPIPHSGETTSLQGRIAISVNAFLAKISDRLVLHSEEFRKLVADKYFIPMKKIVAVPHGTYDFFTKWKQGLPSKRNSILFFGRIVDYKWLDILLESLLIAIESVPELRLTIAGSGDITKYLSTIERLGTHISLVNEEIRDEEVHTYFEMCELVVLPYKDATASGVIPLAYAFEKPVLVTDVGALSHFVIQDSTGCLVPSNDPIIFGKKIVQMLADPKGLTKMGKNGKTWSNEHLGWKEIVQKIYDFDR